MADPKKGDEYLSPMTGVTMAVVAIGSQDGQTWVVFETANGWRCKVLLETVRTWKPAPPRKGTRTHKVQPK